MRTGIDRLRKRIDEVTRFDPQGVTEQYNNPGLDALAAAIDDCLVRTFGANTTEYERYKPAVRFDNGPHNYAYEVQIGEVRQSLARSKARSIALLEQALQSLQASLRAHRRMRGKREACKALSRHR